MRRLGMLVMAIILITGCNATQSNMEEAERLWRETEKNIQKWAISTNVEASPAEKPRIIPAPAAEAPQKTLELVEEPAPQPPAPTPEQDKTLQESIDHHEQVTLPQTEQPVESPVMIDWPYPPITCPSKPDPTPATNWPYITAPEPPTYTPEPKPTEPPQEEPAPTPIPDVPADPVPEPTEQPTEQPAEPAPDPTAEPQTGYAACSCGARLSHEELVPHMKAHALKVENHSYRAY